MQRNFTLIMTTNRVSTAKNCDKIMILENGKITDIGTHEKLLKSSVYYQEIFKSQSAKKEII